MQLKNIGEREYQFKCGKLKAKGTMAVTQENAEELQGAVKKFSDLVVHDETAKKPKIETSKKEK